MSLNFLTRKLKTQKLEENNENEETCSAGQATLNEAEVRDSITLSLHAIVLAWHTLLALGHLVLIDFLSFSGGSTSK